jgi:hypothetical protein
MKRDWSQIAVMLSGTFLVIVGVGEIVFQIVKEGIPGMSNFSEFHGTGEGFTATTHYVGLELVIVGAILQMASLLGGRFHKEHDQPVRKQEIAHLSKE